MLPLFFAIFIAAGFRYFADAAADFLLLMLPLSFHYDAAFAIIFAIDAAFFFAFFSLSPAIDADREGFCRFIYTASYMLLPLFVATLIFSLRRRYADFCYICIYAALLIEYNVTIMFSLAIITLL